MASASALACAALLWTWAARSGESKSLVCSMKPWRERREMAGLNAARLSSKEDQASPPAAGEPRDGALKRVQMRYVLGLEVAAAWDFA